MQAFADLCNALAKLCLAIFLVITISLPAYIIGVGAFGWPKLPFLFRSDTSASYRPSQSASSTWSLPFADKHPNGRTYEEIRAEARANGETVLPDQPLDITPTPPTPKPGKPTKHKRH